MVKLDEGSKRMLNVKVKWIFVLKTNNVILLNVELMIELQANRIWRSKLDVAYWRSHLIAYHVLRIMRVRKILAMIVIVADYLKRVEDSALVRLMLSTCLWLWIMSSNKVRVDVTPWPIVPSLITKFEVGMKALEMWLHKHHLHQTTVVVQVGILTVIRNCEDEGRILNDMHRITIDHIQIKLGTACFLLYNAKRKISFAGYFYWLFCFADGYCNLHGTRISSITKFRNKVQKHGKSVPVQCR
ncbi:hypothetical protein T4B_739 [Trichinella pseudospiralis]|uniref:Uncharacterized protein n=1 Tax=Trichinella pseudospiralis TaxID=6337 RepID=A0A0V1GRB3_TRIPS|nr:hypothetical protein T4B_739 [Trichinella pseudospiralis]